MQDPKVDFESAEIYVPHLFIKAQNPLVASTQRSKNVRQIHIRNGLAFVKAWFSDAQQ